MKIAIFVNTPAQVHFHKNIIRKLTDDGCDVYLLSRDYGETLNVLDELGIDHYIYSRPATSKLGKLFYSSLDIFRAYLYLKEQNVDLVTGFGIIEAYTSLLLGVPSIIFNDSEPSANSKSYLIQFKLFMPLISAIITPESFRTELGKKHVRVNTYKEMAYLHPNYYQPRNDIFNLLGLNQNDDYILLRFNAFDAVHDFGIGGFSKVDKINLVYTLEQYSRVFISSEVDVPNEIKDRVMSIPKSRIHDVIYYAKMLITDTQTMTTEAAILGTPTIRCNHFVGPNDMGNFIELEKKYGLIFNYSEPNKSLSKAIELIQRDDLRTEWQAKRVRLLMNKIDITSFMVRFIEDYTEDLRSTKSIKK